MQTRSVLFLFLIAVLSFGLTACQKKEAPGPPQTAAALTVHPVTAELQKSPGYVELTGSLAGARSVALSTKLMSQITTLSVKEGQRVKSGQTLVVIDDSDLVAMRSEATAYRAEAAAALAEVAAAVKQSSSARKAAAAAVAQAQAIYDENVKELERTERLVEQDTLPRVSADKVRLAVKVAEESLNQAQSGLEQADDAIQQAQSRKPQVEAKMAQAGAKDQQAAALQGYAVLKAPFDGVVTKKYFEPGQLAIPGQPILLLETETGFKAKFEIPEDLAAAQSLGSSMSVLLDTDSAEPELLQGTLTVLGAAADPASHVVPAEISLPTSKGLLSGRFVRVRVPTGEREQIMLDTSAIVAEGEQSYVWRISAGGMVARVPVELGEANAGRVEILRGLSAGDQVVDAPGSDLYPGARVDTSPGQAGVGR